jgi:retron-type reverse transcriptase
MTQFESFLAPENFKLAFMRLQTAPRNLYKEIYHEDLKAFGLFLDYNIDSILQEIRENLFEPSESCKIFIPKKNNLARPISVVKFKDLLAYQAAINIIADSVYDDISPYYENLLFGNSYRTSKEKDSIFFYKPWQKQWKKFVEKSKELYENGYVFFAEFDIASFFDTIDHLILQQILEEYSIDQDLVKFLLEMLEAFTIDSSKKTFKSKHGIPQGPLSSSFLADLYLLHLDLEIQEINKKADVKSIRYVDDIRVFARAPIPARKTIAYLDLLAGQPHQN